MTRMAADKDVTLVVEHRAHREVHRLLDQFLFDLNQFPVWTSDEDAICRARQLLRLLDEAMRHIAKADAPSRRSDIIFLGEPKAAITDAMRAAETNPRHGWAAMLVWCLGGHQERVRKLADGYLADALIGDADLEEEKPTLEDAAQQPPPTISFAIDNVPLTFPTEKVCTLARGDYLANDEDSITFGGHYEIFSVDDPLIAPLLVLRTTEYYDADPPQHTSDELVTSERAAELCVRDGAEASGPLGEIVRQRQAGQLAAAKEQAKTAPREHQPTNPEQATIPAAAHYPCPFSIDPTSGELRVTTATGEVSIKLTPKERECMRPIIAAFPGGVSLNTHSQVPVTYSNHIASVRRKLKGLPNDIETPGDSGKGAGGQYRITAA